jgi:hypothetical protein
LEHYILSFIYSQRSIKAVVSDKRTLPLFALMTLSGFAMAFFKAPMVLLSVFHHNFNEVYMRDVFLIRTPEARTFRLSCFAFNAFLFLTILRHDVCAILSPIFLYVGVAASTVWYAYELFRNRQNFTAKQMVDSVIYELLGFVFLAVSFRYSIGLLHFFLYHFIYWALYPVPGMIRKGPATVRAYAGWHVFLLSLLGVAVYFTNLQKSYMVLPYLLNWFAYVHITMSFVLSKEHPSWMGRIFRPAPAGCTVEKIERSPALARKVLAALSK